MNESETIVLKCKNKDCGQEFNNENIQLAIYLHGIFFLIGSSKGFIGFTCPKCSKTRIYEKTCQEILKIKELLASQVVVTKESINENGNRIIEPISSFESNLEYYSPFTLEDEIRKEFNIHYYGFVNPENNKHFSDQISHYVSEGIFDIDGLLCSFLDIDSDRPSGVFTTIYWYKEENIQSLLQLENENNVRIFPRYHYHTELIEKIDSLIGYHYYMGKPFEKAKEDHKQERQNDLDVINDYAREKNLNYDNIVEMNALNDPETMINIIEKNQESIAKDPKISGKFLDVLLSEPFPLGDILTQGICNYLWIEVDPFHNQAFPEAFVSDIKSDELKAKTEEKMKQHLKMVDRVQENFTKQYVQEFLKKNLIDFLEEYEERFHSKQFSYAYVWELKESFLEGLYEATNKGLRSDSPYAIYREGEGWRIVFNGKPISGLRGKGFLWIYYIISCPEKKVYYRALQEQFGDTEQKKKEGQRDEDHIKELIYADQLTLSDSDVFSNKESDP